MAKTEKGHGNGVKESTTLQTGLSKMSCKTISQPVFVTRNTNEFTNNAFLWFMKKLHKKYMVEMKICVS